MMYRLFLCLILVSASAAFGQSTARENAEKVQKLDNCKIVERDVNGVHYAWVEVRGQAVSNMFNGKDARKQAQAFRTDYLSRSGN
jgi:hypothetical protein